MARYSFISTALFAASTIATNAVPDVPLNAQIGLLDFPITCDIYGGLLRSTFEARFVAIAPVYGNTSQEIYYTDVSGQIRIPSSITSLAPLIGATQAQANVTANLRLENGSPSNFVAFKGTLDGIKFPAGGVGLVNVPASGSLPPLGPIRLGLPGVAHRIYLGEIDVSIELQNSAGKGVFGPIPVKCGKQTVDTIIGSVNVLPQRGGDALMPTVDGLTAADFPATPELFESGSFRFPYSCQFGGLGKYALDLIISGTIPVAVKPNSPLSLTNAQSFLRLPADLVALAKQTYPSLSRFDTTVTEFLLSVNNASPNTVNVATTPLKSSVSANSDSQFIALPDQGYLSIPAFTSGADGTIISLQAGASNATVDLIANDGSNLLSLAVTCDVPAPLELIGVLVTSKSYDNYTLFGGNQNKN